MGMRCSDLEDILQAVYTIKICMEQAWAKGLGQKSSQGWMKSVLSVYLIHANWVSGRVSKRTAEVKDLEWESQQTGFGPIKFETPVRLPMWNIFLERVAPFEKFSRFHLPPVSHLTYFEEEMNYLGKE